MTIWRCANCRTGFFPERLLCPRCHGDEFEADRVHEAVVEEISVIRHMIGQENWQPRRIASVRTSDGQRMTVGLPTMRSASALRSKLFQEGTAPFGRLKA